jgi:hypothetical protein
MTGVEVAAAVAIAEAIVGEVAGPAMRPVGRRIDAVLDRNTVPTVIESAIRGALDDTAAAHPDIVGVLLDAHFLDNGASHLLAGLLAPGRSISAKELSEAWARQFDGVDSAPHEILGGCPDRRGTLRAASGVLTVRQ